MVIAPGRIHHFNRRMALMKRDTLLSRYQDALWVVGLGVGNAFMDLPVTFDFRAQRLVIEDDGNLGATFIENRVITIDLPQSRVFAGRA